MRVSQSPPSPLQHLGRHTLLVAPFLLSFSILPAATWPGDAMAGRSTTSERVVSNGEADTPTGHTLIRKPSKSQMSSAATATKSRRTDQPTAGLNPSASAMNRARAETGSLSIGRQIVGAAGESTVGSPAGPSTGANRAPLPSAHQTAGPTADPKAGLTTPQPRSGLSVLGSPKLAGSAGPSTTASLAAPKPTKSILANPNVTANTGNGRSISGRGFTQLWTRFPQLQQVVNQSQQQPVAPPAPSVQQPPTPSPTPVVTPPPPPPPPAPLPTLSAQPGSLSFTATAGGSNPANQALTITSTGGNSPLWSVGDNAGWLTMGSASGAGTQSMAISVNTAGLAAGTYSAVITVSSAGAANGSVVIPVTLSLNAPAVVAPTLNISPASLSFTVQAGSSPTVAQTLSISNVGGSTLNWTADDPSAWLLKSALSGSGNGSVSLWVDPTGLAAGTYTSSVTIAATGATNTPRIIPVNLTVTAAPPAPQPTISMSPTVLSFSGTQGGANPANQSIAVANTGAGTLTWTVSDNSAWLTATQSGNSIVASVNLTSLAVGSHSAAITVTASGATNTPQTIPVTLVVSAPTTNPTIGLSPTSLSFSGTVGGVNPTNQSITVQNTGTGTLTWSVTDNQSWMTATQSGNTVLTAVTLAGLAAGTYSGQIIVAASGATNTPQTIPVTLTVNAAPAPSPTIALSPGSLSFTVPAGSSSNSASQTVTISNSGGGTLNWTVTDPVDWLQKSALSGSGNGSVALWIAPTGLTAGTYSTTVTVSASNATNPVVAIPVSLTVTAAPATIALSPTSLAFTATTSGSNPGNQSIGVNNSGGGTLSWSVTDNANWLTATQSGNTVVASVNKSGLSAGTYNGTITIAASGATNTPQTVPVSLTISSGTVNQTATLIWNANGESDLAGYKIYRATESGAYGAPIATIVGNQTSHVVSGLQIGTYFFVITAYDNAGNESAWSNEVSKSIY